jgi:hypothetical protein
MVKCPVLSLHLLEGTERNHKKNLSGYQLSGPRFEPETYRIQSRSANLSAATFSMFFPESKTQCFTPI